jgi:hypothetical protein
MAMIDIEYRHSAQPPHRAGELRRTSIGQMHDYLNEIVCEMQMADISSKLIDTEGTGPNMVYINGKTVFQILEGLDIKMPDAEESCDHGNVTIIKFDRPTLDWKKDIIEDIPDILMKNAIAKVFADINNNRIL